MAIGNAMKLLKEIDSKPELRKSINACTSVAELEGYLKSIDREFTMYEMEEAVNHLHTQCGTHQQAERLMAKAHWYAMVIHCLHK